MSDFQLFFDRYVADRRAELQRQADATRPRRQLRRRTTRPRATG
jgi:hypothetical protein